LAAWDGVFGGKTESFDSYIARLGRAKGRPKLNQKQNHTDICFVHGFSAGRVAVGCCWG